MGEYDRRIAVLRNLRGGALDLGDQRLDIPRADERGEFRTESQLLAPFIGSQNIEPLIGEIESALAQISQNGNPTIVFTHFALAVSKMIKRL